MVYHERDIRVDEYHHPMKDARKIKDIEDDYDEEPQVVPKSIYFNSEFKFNGRTESVSFDIPEECNKCKSCRKAKEVPCFNEGSEKCWFEMNQEIKPVESMFLTPEEIALIPEHTEEEDKAEKLAAVLKAFDKSMKKMLKESIIPEGAPKQKDVTKTTIAGATGPSENNPGTELIETGACGATIFYDVEKLAERMPGKSKGFTKNGTEMGKPKCPICNVTVSDFGMCPVCERLVVRRFDMAGTIKTVFRNEIDSIDKFRAPEKEMLYKGDNNQVEVHLQGENDIGYIIKTKVPKEYVKELKVDKKWLKDEVISKENFTGTVNKKSDGRSCRGEIPEAKDPERMLKFRHTPGVKLDVRVKVIKRDEPLYVRNRIPVLLVKPDLDECECGCKVTLKDMRRGEKLCPRCGLVLSKFVFHINLDEEDD